MKKIILFVSSVLTVNLAFAQYKPPENYISLLSDFKKTVSIDTVAKVLNYSDGNPDEGAEYSFWYALDAKNCIYAKAESGEGTTSPDGKTITYSVKPKVKIMDLNSFDKTSIKFLSQQINYPSILGAAPRTTPQVYIYVDGREIFRTEGIDMERARKGWSVIYSKYCVGARKEF
jgi:hypothetical protein